jgi:hypothetical protein
MRSQPARVFAVLAVSALFAAGCGSDGPPATSSREEATVKGTVTLRGKPVTEGEIVFDPANINRRDAAATSSAIGKDGTYSVKALVGENAVMVNSEQVSNDPTIGQAKKFFDVKSGENTFMMDLP